MYHFTAPNVRDVYIVSSGKQEIVVHILNVNNTDRLVPNSCEYTWKRLRKPKRNVLKLHSAYFE